MINKRDVLLAGAIADAAGYIIEFYKLSAIRKIYGEGGLTLDKIPETAPLFVSDDTQMTLFALEACEKIKRDHVSNGIRYYIDSFNQWFITQSTEKDGRIGDSLSIFESMNHLRAPGNSCLSALATKAPVYSKGCGGVMRAAPCGFFNSFEDAFNEGIIQAQVTHMHPNGFLPAGVMAGLISLLNDTYTVDSALLKCMALLAKQNEHKSTYGAIDLAIQLAQEPSDHVEDINLIGEGWVGDEALAIAIYAVLAAKTKSFEECIAIAINHDGDSDSTGSIAAQIWAAAYGLPEQYKAWDKRLDIYDAFTFATRNL